MKKLCNDVNQVCKHMHHYDALFLHRFDSFVQDCLSLCIVHSAACEWVAYAMGEYFLAEIYDVVAWSEEIYVNTSEKVESQLTSVNNAVYELLGSHSPFKTPKEWQNDTIVPRMRFTQIIH